PPGSECPGFRPPRLRCRHPICNPYLLQSGEGSVCYKSSWFIDSTPVGRLEPIGSAEHLTGGNPAGRFCGDPPGEKTEAIPMTPSETQTRKSIHGVAVPPSLAEEI